MATREDDTDSSSIVGDHSPLTEQVEDVADGFECVEAVAVDYEDAVVRITYAPDTTRTRVKKTLQEFATVGRDPDGSLVAISTSPHVRFMLERLRTGESISGDEPAPVHWVAECDLDRL